MRQLVMNYKKILIQGGKVITQVQLRTSFGRCHFNLVGSRMINKQHQATKPLQLQIYLQVPHTLAKFVIYRVYQNIPKSVTMANPLLTAEALTDHLLSHYQLLNLIALDNEWILCE